MKVNQLYDNYRDINLNTYLAKHGIDNPIAYLNPDIWINSEYIGKVMEDWRNYDNIDYGVYLIDSMIGVGKINEIYLLVDSDIDGYTSAAEIYLYLKQIYPNLNIKYFIHNGKIHGLNDERIMEELRNSSSTLLIIPDAQSLDEHYMELGELGYTTLVLDHHESCDNIHATIVNNQFSPNVINKQASGSIVTHQFLRALDSHYGVRYANNYIDLAMCGMVGDVMELNNYYNRTYCFYGFNNITNPFLKALFEKFIKDEITPHSISFNIVPKVNATIRGDDYELKVDMFKAFIGEADPYEVANRCKKQHDKQRENVKEISSVIYSLADLKKKVIVSEYNDMLPSYAGLIAGKVSGDTNKPAVIVKYREDEGLWYGSMRSPVPLIEEFNALESVEWCNGHDKAAGICINNLDKFRQECEELDLNQDIIYDVTYSFDDVYKIPPHLFEEFADYKCLWGKGLEEPVFHIKNININGRNVQEMGRGKTTIKFNYKGVDFLMFFASQEAKNDFCVGVNKNIKLEIIGTLNMNEWKNNKYPQVIIDKYEIKDFSNMDWSDVF